MQASLKTYQHSAPELAFHRCPRCKQGYWVSMYERGHLECPAKDCAQLHKISRRGVACFLDQTQWD